MNVVRLKTSSEPLVMKYGKEHRLYEQGELSEEILIVEEGLVVLSTLTESGRKQIIGIQGKGTIIGDIEGVNKSSFSAESFTDVVVRIYHRNDFPHQASLFELLLSAQKTIAAQRIHMAVLGYKRADKRVAAFLLSLLHNSDENEICNGTSVIIPMSGTDLGDYLCIDSATVSRAITILENGGLIARNGYKVKNNLIFLKDLDGLYGLAGFTIGDSESMFTV